MKILVNKDNPQIRITAPEIEEQEESQMYLIPVSDYCIPMYIDDWTLVEEEPKHTEVWVEGRTIFEQDAKKPDAGVERAFKQFSDILDKWEAHAIEGMKVGASAYHQGKIALICDLRDWIKEQTKGGNK